MRSPSRLAAGVLLALLLLAAGCGRHLQQTLGLRNQPPVVQLESTFAPASDDQTPGARLSWRGFDPDGRVDHFLVTEDVAAFDRESGWTVSTARDQALTWRRPTRGAVAPVRAEAAFRFFAVKAVDDRGAVSDPAYRAFFGENVAPTVTIVQPRPSPLLWRACPPDLTIRWAGSDPDGPSERPAQYKYRLFDRRDPGWNRWLANPDSLRAEFAPAFAGWDSIGGKAGEVQYTGLTPGDGYLFVITALDAKGAYDPVFSLSKNMLLFNVGYDETSGARLTLFNSSFTYTYLWGGIPDSLDLEEWAVHVQAPAGQPLTIHWRGENPITGPAVAYRWALDMEDFRDEKVRRNRNDPSHWSEWDPATTSVTIDERMLSKLPAADSHRLFVESVDEVGVRSLGVVEFRFVAPTFDRDLLVVDDTRLKPDYLSPTQPPGRTDSLSVPHGSWPTAAELDTFLFAVGGVRWRMAPAGRTSGPGLFHGYRFDTLGTRGSAEDPTLPIELLSHYRHIIWITDLASSEMMGRATSPLTPITTLRYMSTQNRQSSLASWVAGGGRLWALGGGFGNATNAPWNNVGNDGTLRVYSSAGTRPDLTPGRFMYDLAHWRSEFTVASTHGCRVTRAPGAGIALPGTLRWKSPLTDPIWPYRIAADFYGDDPAYGTIVRGIEYLTKPNGILEDQNPSPKRTLATSMLDTLMVVSGPGLPGTGAPPYWSPLPTMTCYRGAECGPVTFSGFDLWRWARADAQQLVDAVLQGQWGLARGAPEPVARAAARR